MFNVFRQYIGNEILFFNVLYLNIQRFTLKRNTEETIKHIKKKSFLNVLKPNTTTAYNCTIMYIRKWFPYIGQKSHRSLNRTFVARKT